MSNLMQGTSAYATGSIDTTDLLVNGVSSRAAEHINGPAAGVVQIEQVLGSALTLVGTHATLVARLATALNSNGTLKLDTPAALSGQLTVPNGGTGVATVSSGDYVVGAGTSALTTVPRKGWVWVSTTTVSLSSSATLTGLAPSFRYRLMFVGATSSNPNLRLRFNGDTTGYSWGTEVTDDTGGGLEAAGGGTTTYIDLTGGLASAVGEKLDTIVNFRTQQADSTRIAAHFSTVLEDGTITLRGATGHGSWKGSASLSTVEISVSTGTVSGELTLERFIP